MGMMAFDGMMAFGGMMAFDGINEERRAPDDPHPPTLSSPF
jgi:hypothetical protein